MKQHFATVKLETKGPGLHGFTDHVVRFLADSKLEDGLLTCFVRHTSASLLI